MRTRGAKKLVSCGLALIATACLWFWFAPTVLGGSTSYVTTEGVSMQPRFHTGDLALVRGKSSYRVGEIVAYHSKALHTVVLHRIIARAGDRYVFKGDNNNFLDVEHPAGGQLIGALWIHIPGAGARLQSLRSPALTGALFAVGVLLFAGAAFARRQRRRRRQRRAGEGGGSQPRLSEPWFRLPRGGVEHLLGVLAVGVIAMLPFLALALLAFTRPTSALAPVKVPYAQSGTLSYAAKAATGPVYPNDRAVTGDPLFTHVIKDVDFSFAYRFHSNSTHSLAGKASLYVTITSTSGWQTTRELGRAAYFRGDRAQIKATLDLVSLGALLHHVETTTAVSGTYTLTLVPHVSVGGSLGTVPLHTSFMPPIRFSLNRDEVRPVVSGGGAITSGRPSASVFAPSSSGSAAGRHHQTTTISLKLVRLSVMTARRVALIAIVIIVYVLLSAVIMARPRRRDESASILARYGSAIVPVACVWQQPGVAVIDVADIESLVRIAGHYDRSILHEQTDYGEAFWVTDESGQFRYALGATDAVEEEEPVTEQLHAHAYSNGARAEESDLGSVLGFGAPLHA